MQRPAWCSLAALALVCLVAAAPGSRATFHWAVAGLHADRIDLSSTPILRDAVVFYEHHLGLIPRFWAGKPEHGGIPQNADLRAHLAKLRLDIEQAMPGDGWTGLGMIDIEAWTPLWRHASEEARAQTRAQVLRRHPTRPAADIERIARADYELAVRNFLEATLRECRSTRPRVRWGFYGWPDPAFGADVEELQWLWDECTAFFPVCYVVYHAEPGGVHQQGKAPPEEFIEDARRKIAACRKVAGSSKPVYACVWVRYHELNPVIGGKFLDRSDLGMMLKTPLEAGVDGFVFWDQIDTPELAAGYRDCLINRLAPAIAAVRSDMGSKATRSE